ncbi:hypothetical protein FA15DRAFT_655141 [Coprinopsis marcescibilis]|uniref:Uncharacterized protein n=1 Tax=Coprinopsis marcescibilis TaxID=230819 RepID=A0A5C3KYI7_COPMA|nr:hypothetical protein FA15DRAFT_655141 [Coprinopsis marcescibilis]
MTTRYCPPRSIREGRIPSLLKLVMGMAIDQTRTGPRCVYRYDSKVYNLGIWRWPLKGTVGARVPPDELCKQCLYHNFRLPSCLCTYLNGTNYSESVIGLVEHINGLKRHFNGQYAFECAKQRCGYYAKALHLDTLIAIEEQCEPSLYGLRQVLVGEDFSLRGLRSLRKEDPDYLTEAMEDIQELAIKGLSEERFWDVFVQCLRCKRMMPRYLFPYQHQCGNVVEEGEQTEVMEGTMETYEGLDDHQEIIAQDEKVIVGKGLAVSLKEEQLDEDLAIIKQEKVTIAQDPHTVMHEDDQLELPCKRQKTYHVPDTLDDDDDDPPPPPELSSSLLRSALVS